MENLFAAGMTDDGHTFTQARGRRQDDAPGRRDRPRPAPARRRGHRGGGLAGRRWRRSRASSAATPPFWRPSTDARHIAVGLLVKHGVEVSNVHQLGRDATTTESGCADDPTSHKLFERPPLQVDVRKDGLSFTLIGNHLASQSHPEPCRQAQAEFLHDAAATIEAAGGQVMVIGDLNDFEDSPRSRRTWSPGVTLKNLWSEAPADNRYSFQFDGQLQTLDHIFVTDGLHAGVRDVRYVHFDNDYFERDETRHAAGVSDHDPPVVTITLPGRWSPLEGAARRFLHHRGEAAGGGATVAVVRAVGECAGGCWIVGSWPTTDRAKVSSWHQSSFVGAARRAPRRTPLPR